MSGFKSVDWDRMCLNSDIIYFPYYLLIDLKEAKG